MPGTFGETIQNIHRRVPGANKKRSRDVGLIQQYIENMLLYIIVLLPIYGLSRWIYARGRIKKKQGEVCWKREVLLVLFVAYVIGIASQTIIPKWDMGVLSETGEFYFDLLINREVVSINLIPFTTIAYFFSTSGELISDWKSVVLVNLLGNVALFIPFGLLLPQLWRKFRSLKSIVIMSIAIPFTIEFIQYFIGRSSDIDDVLLNAIGILLGYFFWTCIRHFSRGNLKRSEMRA